MDRQKRERIEKLWDELTTFDASQTEIAMRHLLSILMELIEANVASWFASVRLSEIQENDPTKGWRPASTFYINNHQKYETLYKKHCKRIDQGLIDPSIIENLKLTGQFRVTVHHQIVPSEWYQSEFYQNFFESYGIQDGLYTAMPLGEDVESWLNFQRVGYQQPFFHDDAAEIVETAVRPLKWLHHRLALHYGLYIAEKPLTPTERRVLNALLSDKTELQIANRLQMAQSSVHTYCTRICRKFNVRGRAGLLALWLGKK